MSARYEEGTDFMHVCPLPPLTHSMRKGPVSSEPHAPLLPMRPMCPMRPMQEDDEEAGSSCKPKSRSKPGTGGNRPDMEYEAGQL